MKTIVISWILPTTRQQGGPLAVSDIGGVEIELSADAGVNFTPVGVFTPDILQTQVADLPFGDQYQVRGRVIDQTGQAGNWAVELFSLADDSPPGDLTVTVTPQ
jgi:hypothetical protein